jgi:hypothetical protein
MDKRFLAILMDRTSTHVGGNDYDSLREGTTNWLAKMGAGNDC